MTFTAGTKLGRYEIRSLIGVDGMGGVDNRERNRLEMDEMPATRNRSFTIA